MAACCQTILSPQKRSISISTFAQAPNRTNNPPSPQGCCASRPPHDDGLQNDRETTDRAHDTRNSIAATSTQTQTQTTRRPTRRVPDLPLSEHYNEPVHLHVWHSKRRIWTRDELDRERREFFETRVTGRPEIWAALSAAVTLMRENDLATAQSIVDAVGVTIPTGDLCEGCYDEQGVLYRLPQCIVSDPTNMAQTSPHTPSSTQEDEDTEALSDGKLATDDASVDELIAEDAERRRDEKGKTKERDLICVQARLSDRGGPDLTLMVGKGRSVGFLARKVQQEGGVCIPFAAA